MLVLSRFKDESIMIGDDIVVTVTEILEDRVKIGICAPKKTAVDREEIYHAKKRDAQ